jgi:hypothetical protein
MPAQLTYPGVYIEEIPSGVRTIIGVATSITAFLGRAKRGPVNEPKTINSYGDFERIFGGLWKESKLGFAVRDFFLNGGSQAIIVRLFHSAALDIAKKVVKAVEDEVAKGDIATRDTVLEAAKGARTALNLADNDPLKAAADIVVGEAQKAFDAHATKDGIREAVEDVVGKAAAISTKATITCGENNLLNLEAAYEGKWGNNLRARIDHNVTGKDAANHFNLSIHAIFEDGSEQTEFFRNVSVVKGHPRRVDKVLENESKLVRILGELPGARPEKHPDPEPGEKIWEDNDPITSAKVADLDKASDDKGLELDDFTGPGKENKKEGLYALRKADLFNILCIPPYLGDGNIDSGLIDSAIDYCQDRRAMMLIDPPTSWIDKDAAKEGIEKDPSQVGPASKNAALFFPRLRQPNPLNDNQMEDFGPCGAVAGIFARTDTQRGVWKAPAGLDATLLGVPQLSVPLNDAENGELNPLGINCLRSMPPAGRVVWGARTREGDDRLTSEWKYIPVRRTALFIEETLFRSTKWVVFEPNDEPLWAQIRLNIGAFMHSLFRQGAFQGRTPQEAYFVKCDKETTTQNDIDRGIVNIIVGFAPLKPAEFVVIKLQQMAGQIQT